MEAWILPWGFSLRNSLESWYLQRKMDQLFKQGYKEWTNSFVSTNDAWSGASANFAVSNKRWVSAHLRLSPNLLFERLFSWDYGEDNTSETFAPLSNMVLVNHWEWKLVNGREGIEHRHREWLHKPHILGKHFKIALCRRILIGCPLFLLYLRVFKQHSQKWILIDPSFSLAAVF